MLRCLWHCSSSKPVAVVSVSAKFPRIKLVAADPPLIAGPLLVAIRVHPSAVLGAAVIGLPVELRALLPFPFAVAVLGFPRFPCLAPIPVRISVAADPVVVSPVIVCRWGVPPTAGLRIAVIILIVLSRALLPDPGAIA